jgi:hypothetical protein
MTTSYLDTPLVKLATVVMTAESAFAGMKTPNNVDCDSRRMIPLQDSPKTARS